MTVMSVSSTLGWSKIKDFFLAATPFYNRNIYSKEKCSVLLFFFFLLLKIILEILIFIFCCYIRLQCHSYSFYPTLKSLTKHSRQSSTYRKLHYCIFKINTISKWLPHVPKQRVSVPLQSPDDRHSLTADPTSMKPTSQVKMAVAPNEVWVPIFFPLVGDGSSPQEITEEHSQADMSVINEPVHEVSLRRIRH